MDKVFQVIFEIILFVLMLLFVELVIRRFLAPMLSTGWNLIRRRFPKTQTA